MLLSLELLDDSIRKVEEIESGKCFLYQGRAYMKAFGSDSGCNVVQLDTGMIDTFSATVRVEVVELVAVKAEDR